ncbi:MAG TPA: glycerol-3-phosphate dehydrogenase C-terminal domain-containing protein, partial [Leptospiraceae bacterium]|nr:glycerol-3-phosphate dehydrogenase C-terminal domain-containing protein [Leptospiraceae bacterium]
SEQSIREFLADINQTFGKEVLKFSDIQHAYGGLRPLTDTHTESTYSSSRKYEVLDGERDGNAGLITVEGGKYTTSRNLAEGVLRMVKKKLGRKIPATSTRKKPLSGSEMYSIRQFVEDARSGNPGFDKDTLEFLARAFGTAYKEVLALAAENQAFKERITSDGEILAEVVYAVRKEMARHLLDVVLRRTGVGDLGLPPDEILQKIARVMADELSWTDVKMQSEIADAKRYLTLPGKSK